MAMVNQTLKDNIKTALDSAGFQTDNEFSEMIKFIDIVADEIINFIKANAEVSTTVSTTVATTVANATPVLPAPVVGTGTGTGTGTGLPGAIS